MLSTGHRSFSSLPPLLQELLLQLIRAELQPLLQLPPDLSPEAWALAVRQANPMFCYCYDVNHSLEIEDTSRAALLERLQQLST